MALYSCIENNKTKYRIECDCCGKTIEDYLTMEEVSKLISLNNITTVGEYSDEYGIDVLKYFCGEDCKNKYLEG